MDVVGVDAANGSDKTGVVLIVGEKCGKCEAIKAELKKAGIGYVEITDTDFFAGRIPQEVSENVRSKIMSDLLMSENKALPIVYDADGVRK